MAKAVAAKTALVKTILVRGGDAAWIEECSVLKNPGGRERECSREPPGVIPRSILREDSRSPRDSPARRECRYDCRPPDSARPTCRSYLITGDSPTSKEAPVSIGAKD